MYPHKTKDDSLGNLKRASNFLHEQRYRERKRQDVIREFDNKPLYERQRLFNNYKGCKHNLCFINDYAKLSIMGYFGEFSRVIK